MTKDIALMSEMVKGLMDDNGEEEGSSSGNGPTEIPVANVKGKTLKKVIEFCEHYKEEEMTKIVKPLKSDTLDGVVQKWYADYIKVEDILLFDLIKAANYMDIEPLLALTTAAVALLIKPKTVRRVCVWCV